MKQLYFLFFLFSLLSVPARATIRTVNVSDFQFSPSTFTVNVGDTVRWVWQSGSHTTTSTSVPAGAQSWDSPMNSASRTFDYKVTTAGQYSYKCTPHGPSMAGTFTAINSNSVGSTSIQDVVLSPNPTSGKLVAGGFPEGPLVLKLTDLAGRHVAEINTNVTGGFAEADLSLIPAGIYVCTLVSARSSEIRRLVRD